MNKDTNIIAATVRGDDILLIVEGPGPDTRRTELTVSEVWSEVPQNVREMVIKSFSTTDIKYIFKGYE